MPFSRCSSVDKALKKRRSARRQVRRAGHRRRRLLHRLLEAVLVLVSRHRLSRDRVSDRSIQRVIRISAIIGELHVRRRLRSPMIHINTGLRPQRIPDRRQPKPQQSDSNKRFRGSH